MTPDFNVIEDADIKVLAKEIFEAVSATSRVSLFEILSSDIYCQIGEGDLFIFSVEVRGDDAEFFLYDMNFILSRKSDFQSFAKDILDIVKAIVSGNYEIQMLKFGGKVVLSNIVFLSNINIVLYRSIFLPLLNAFSVSVTKEGKKGKAIIGIN